MPPHQSRQAAPGGAEELPSPAWELTSPRCRGLVFEGSSCSRRLPFPYRKGGGSDVTAGSVATAQALKVLLLVFLVLN